MATVPSAALASTETGPPDAPFVVLVHGSLDRSASFAKVVRRVEGDVRVLRYDRRGYGAAIDVPGPHTVAGNVADLGALLGDRPAVLVGHSYGGIVALALAEQRPELVRAVGVYEAPLSWESWWPTNTPANVAMEAAAVDGPAAAAESFLRRLMGDERWSRLPASVQAARRAEGATFLDECRDVWRGPPYEPAGVRAPLVAAHGECSLPHQRRSATELAGRVPGAVEMELAGAAHLGHATHPDGFAAFVRRTVDAAG